MLLGSVATVAVVLGADAATAGAIMHERPADIVMPDDQPAGAAAVLQKVQKVKRLPVAMDDWERDADTLVSGGVVLPVDGCGKAQVGK